MRIIIVGAGRVGYNLAKSLTEENHEVFLIESNEDKATKIDEKLDVKVVIGDGADPDLLKRIGIKDADLVLAVTTSDEANLVVCSLAGSLGAKRRIARVRKTSLSKILDDIGYQQFNINEIINPELVAAQTVLRAIETPGASEVADFADGRILLRAFDIHEDSPLCGARLVDFGDEDFPWPFLIVSVVRNEEVMIPKGDTVIQSDDLIYVLLPAQSLGEFLTLVQPHTRKPKKVIVYGASNAGEYIAGGLPESVKEIILIEEDQDRAQGASERLDRVRVIHGAATEADIFRECGIEAADAYVAASLNDNSNLISSVLAKKMGAKSTLIVTQQADYISLIDALDVDVIVNPQTLAIEQILRLVRGKGISSVTKFLECDAEAVEFVPEPGAQVTKAPLKQLKFPKNSIVGAVYSGDEVHLAKGDTQIKAGEKVIVFCQETAIKKLQSMFTRKTIL